MSMTKHKLWPVLKDYVKIEIYSRDGIKKPRIRIEFDTMPDPIKTDALNAKMPCSACGDPIQFVRARNASVKRGPPKHLYYAATCPLNVKIGCSRGRKAAAEYDHVHAVMKSLAP
jgi:hypothetical protein